MGTANVVKRAGSSVMSAAGRDHRDDAPAQEGRRTAQHHHGVRQFRVSACRSRSRATTSDTHQPQRVQAADDQAHELPRAAAEAVAQQRQLQP